MGGTEMENMKNKKLNLQSLTLYIGAVFIIFVFTVLCQINGKGFLTVSNIQNIITQSSVIALVAIGESIVILTGGIDLSVGSTVGFVGIFGGLLIQWGTPVGLACLISIAVGGLFGLFNGLLVSFGKVPAFITTLGTMEVIRGVTLLINNGQPVAGFPDSLGQITNTELFGGLPISIIYVFVLYALMILTLTSTRFGKHIYAIGGNAHAAKLSGVKTRKVELLVYVIGGVFAAIGGVFLLSRLAYADPNAGSGYEMDAIAAVVLGGMAMSGGKGKLINTLVGALILGTLKSGLQILNVATYYQTIIIGLAIIIAVYFDKAKERKEE